MTPLAPTVQILPRIAPRPVLFITGQYGIEHRIGAHLCARATSPSEHWVVRPPRYTLREQREATDTYGHTVVSFFDRFLRVEG